MNYHVQIDNSSELLRAAAEMIAVRGLSRETLFAGQRISVYAAVCLAYEQSSFRVGKKRQELNAYDTSPPVVRAFAKIHSLVGKSTVEWVSNPEVTSDRVIETLLLASVR